MNKADRVRVGSAAPRLAGSALLALSCGLYLALCSDLRAQASPPEPPPTPGDPLRTVPEKMVPKAPSEEDKEGGVVPKAPTGSLSDKLGKNQGVIRPPTDVDPEMNVPPPKNQGKMPVIPPPGSPDNPSPIVPK